MGNPDAHPGEHVFNPLHSEVYNSGGPENDTVLLSVLFCTKCGDNKIIKVNIDKDLS